MQEVCCREVQRQPLSESWGEKGRRGEKELPFYEGIWYSTQGVLYLVAAADEVSC